MQTFSQPLFPVGTQPTDTLSVPFYEYSGGAAGADVYIDVGVDTLAYGDGVEKQITWGFNDEFYSAEVYQEFLNTDTATSSSIEELTADVVSSDTAGLADDQSLSVDISQDDVGVAVEGGEFIELTDATGDFGTATETETAFRESAFFTELEDVYAVDGQSLEVTLSDTDAGLGDETQFDLQTPEHFDNLINVESEAVAADIVNTDSASVTETHLLDIFSTDSSIVVESEVTAADIVSTDAIGTADNLTLLEAFYSQTDSNGTTTELNFIAVDITDVDTNLTTELHSLEVTLSNADTMAALETEILGKQDVDAGALVSDDELLYVDIFDTDSASTVETELLPISGPVSLDTDPYYAQVLISNPLSFWRFAEMGGNLVHDKQDRLDGILYGPLVYDRGLVAGENTAFRFDGTQRVEFGDPYYDYDEFSLEFVARDVLGELVMKTAELEVVAGVDGITFSVFSSDGSIAYYGECAETSGHFVWSITSGLARLFCNGELHFEYIKSASDFNTFNALIIGNGATGMLDDVSIYSRGLLPDEIFKHYYAAILNQNYNTIVQGYRPLVHLPFRGNAEEYNSMFDPIITGAPTYVDGPEKYFVDADLAINFATSESVEYTIDSLLDGLETYTIGGSFNMPSGSTARWLIRGGASGWGVRIDSNGRLRVRNGTTDVVGTNILDDDTWHTFFAVWDGTRMYLYIDGLLDQDVALTQAFVSSPTLQVGIAVPGSLGQLFITEHPMTEEQTKLLYDVIQHGRSDIVAANSSSFELRDDGFSVYTYSDDLLPV